MLMSEPNHSEYALLVDFIRNRMRMSHIYQPVMLEVLLRNGGESTEREIAEAILSHDESQIEYYQKITRDMVGRVLRTRGIVTREGNGYHLNGYDKLSPEEVEALIGLCNSKRAQYLANRGAQVWHHRRRSTGYISGTLRYEILKRARFRCDLCGISADEKALEVDHILPRNYGGSDEPSNLQALCYSCNAMKRDRDATDFREVRAAYSRREAGCIFCDVTKERMVADCELAYVLADAFPATPLHALIIPKRHTSDFFDLGSAEVNAVNALLRDTRERIRQQDSTVEGFNVGINSGEVAGQTVMHAHVHLIPRRSGDVQQPAGGVRHVIPGRGNYLDAEE
jgi:ATP adenylyltransferase